MSSREEEEEIARHANITCDECGACPLLGIRYKATHIYDYDVCESCMKEFDDKIERDKYVAIEKPVASAVAHALGPERDSGIRSSSFRDAAEKIGSNEETEYAFLQLWGTGPGLFEAQPENDDREKLLAALASNTHLRVIHIHMCFSFSGSFGSSIADLARGLMLNKSIKRVFWCISKADRLEMSEKTLSALREMIQKNTTIEALYLKRTCGKSRTADGIDPAEDSFAAAILDALKQNKCIKKFRLDTYYGLSEKNKDTILEIVAENPSIERVHVEFEAKDSRLELLLACKREKWMEQFGDVSASRKDRLEVLLDARNYTSVEPTAAVYQVLRGSPEFPQNGS